MGLHIMNYRAGTIGGVLTIKKEPSGGTTVACLIQKAALNWAI
jgi:nitrate/nitrite-specific signal transduction histidine kinase